MRSLLTILILFLTTTIVLGQDASSSNQQHEMFIKGGIGTSWIILPKVFIISPDDSITNAQILPATNGFTGYAGLQTVFPLGAGWLFVPEVNLSYTSGEIRVNRTEYQFIGTDTIRSSETAQKLQSYVRAEIPLHFGVRSKDNFWVSFGPTLYFTLHDNKGFNNAVYELPVQADLKLNSNVAFGVRFRLAAYAPIGERSYIDIKFESDLGQYFTFEEDSYKAKFSLQNLSIGYGYLLNK